MKRVLLNVLLVALTVSFIEGEFNRLYCNPSQWVIRVTLPASPFLENAPRKRRSQRSQVTWKQPEDNWNITTVPRSVLPHLMNRNFTHLLPAPGNIQYRVINADERMMERFHEIKVSLSSRYDNEAINQPQLISGKCLSADTLGKVRVGWLSLFAVLWQSP